MAEQVYSGRWSQNGVWQLCQGVWAAQWQGRNLDDFTPFISKSLMYVHESSMVIKKKGKSKPAWHSFGMTSIKKTPSCQNRTEKLKKNPGGGKNEKMADQSVKELDAEQTCQEILAMSQTIPALTILALILTSTLSSVLCKLFHDIRYSRIYNPLKSLPSLFSNCSRYIYYSGHLCNLWHSMRFLFLL